MEDQKTKIGFEAMLMEQLESAVGEAVAAELDTGGISPEMSRFEAIAAALAVKAMRGDTAATKLICEVAGRLTQQKPQQPREVRIVVVRD